MRWDAQRADAGRETADPALPGMPPLPGHIRTVRPPEFRGVTIHEVHAKSVLNRVPGNSPMPFRWTVNPYRGCTHACTYCLDPATSITLADGRQRPLGEIQVGDLVMGTRVEGKYRRYTASRVLDRWVTHQMAHRITLADGTVLIASADHRFLTARGWASVRGEQETGGARLDTADVLRGFGRRRPFPDLAGTEVGSAADLRVVSIKELRQQDLIDISTETEDFVAEGVISHNCFARNTHTYLELDAGDDFDRQIVAKTNAATVLRRELAKPGWGREHVALGTNTDPYQRAEGRYALMPGIIEALADSGTPFSILTKGTVLGRDLDRLAAAAEKVPVGIGISLALLDPELQATLEPGTPSPKARLGLIRRVRDAGLPCGVFLAPLLPHLTDGPGQIQELVQAVLDAGATGVSGIALHLRPGSKEWFLRWLGTHRPDLVPVYERLYRRGAYLSVEDRRRPGELVRAAATAAGLGGFEDALQGGGLRNGGVPGEPRARFPDGSLPPERAEPVHSEPVRRAAGRRADDAGQLTLL